jgi:hypothetical protein
LSHQAEEAILDRLPAAPRPRHLFFSFGLGFAAGVVLPGLALGIAGLWARRGRAAKDGR